VSEKADQSSQPVRSAKRLLGVTDGRRAATPRVLSVTSVETRFGGREAWVALSGVIVDVRK